MAVPTIQDPSPTTNGVSGAAAKEATNGHTSELTMTSPVNEMPHSTQVYKTNGTSSYGRSASRLSSGSGLASPLHGRSARHTNGDSYTVYVVEKHTATLHKRCMMELGASKAQGIFSTSYATFIEWIRTERLTTLPHKSGRWDKVLIWAQHFAERFNAFNGAVRAFVSDSDNAARLMFGCCLLLLELGFENAEALEKAFGFINHSSMDLSIILERSELFGATQSTQEQLGLAYMDLLSLVSDIAVHFHKATHGMHSASVSIDLFHTFGQNIESFRSRRARIVEEMWHNQLAAEFSEHDEVVEIQTLRRWLTPADRIVAAVTSDHTHIANYREELTCTWALPQVASFLQQGEEKAFHISAPTGHGKTMLASSIVDRLQRPMGKRSFVTAFCLISSELASQADLINVAKGLLLQILDRRTGDLRMYYALVDAYRQTRQCYDANAYADLVWMALSKVLTTSQGGGKDFVLIIDGLDELTGGDGATQSLLKRLGHCLGKQSKAKLIVFSTGNDQVTNTKTRHLRVAKDHIQDDIIAVVRRRLRAYHHFHHQTIDDQDRVLWRIATTADGSFVLARLVCKLLVLEQSHTSFLKALDETEKAHRSVKDTVQKLVHAMELNNTAKSVLGWLLVAQRPLTTAEVRILLQVDTQRGYVADKAPDIRDVLRTLSSLIIARDGLVHFRHPSVRVAFRDLVDKGKYGMPFKDCHFDLTTRVLIYVKECLHESHEPTFTTLDHDVTSDLFQKYQLLEYAVRYWGIHVRKTPLLKTEGEMTLTADFKTFFPSDTTFALLEKACWDEQMWILDTVEMHELVSRIRHHALGDRQASVLQSYLTRALYDERLHRTREASHYHFESSKICRSIFSPYHDLTIQCSEHFLRITESLTATTRTEIMVRREETIKVLITAYTHIHGQSSDIVVRMQKSLAELYIHIHEESNAAEVYRLIATIYVELHGEDSDEAKGMHKHLDVVLKRRKHDEDINSYDGAVLTGEAEEYIMDVLDLRRVTILVRMAESFFAKGDLIMCERTYVELWMRVSEHCRTVNNVEWHEAKLRVVIAYAKFLMNQKRNAECSDILLCLWEEYEHHELSFSEILVVRFIEIGKIMKSVALFAVALSVYKHAWSFFKSSHKKDNSIFLDIQKEITTTSTELIRASTTTTSETSTTVISESTLREVFESTIESSTVTVDSTTMTLCKTLSAMYMAGNRCSAAIKVIKSVLKKTWSSFFSSSFESVTLTSMFLEESFELVQRLAICYRHESRFEKVEETYMRLFRAVRSSLRIDNVLVQKATDLLLLHLEERSTDVGISIYQKLLVEYRKFYGSSHAITVKTLYALGRLCRLSPRTHGYWIEYYQEIVNTLNKGSVVCHVDAMDAIIVVATYYYEDKRYAEALSIYKVCWHTFIHKHSEYKEFGSSVYCQRIYERYTRCLEETCTDYTVIRQVAMEFRETCIKFFGASATITITATLSLARVLRKSEEHQFEAIALYEEILKTSSDTVIISEAKESLSILCTKQMTSTNTTTSTKTVERAIGVYKERFTHTKSTYGCFHQSSLTLLRDLVMLYVKQQKTEVAVTELRNTMVDIITKGSSSKQMFEAATSLALTFKACGYSKHALELTHEVQRQVVVKDARNTKKFGFDLTTCGRSAFVFLAAFEYHFRSDEKVSFSEIISDIVMESVFFEHYRRSIKQNDSFEVIFAIGARLRCLLLSRNRIEITTLIEDELVEVFMAREASVLKLQSGVSARTFVISILEYLGRHKSQDFISSVSHATNDRLAVLIKIKKFREAYELAMCTSRYVHAHSGYKTAADVSHGFKLAIFMAGRGEERCPDEQLRKQMLDLSRHMLKDVLDICKTLKIEMSRVPLPELNRLVGLLGDQQDWVTLETLYHTRASQASWSLATSFTLGKRLVCACYLTGHHASALHLAQDIHYNLRRARGSHHPATLEMAFLLSELYTSAGAYQQSHASSSDKAAAEARGKDFFRKALGVHEDALRQLVGVEDGNDDSDGLDQLEDGDDDFVDASDGSSATAGNDLGASAGLSMSEPQQARQHMRLMRCAFSRLGSWPKDFKEYDRLNDKVYDRFGLDMKGIEGVERWTAGKNNVGNEGTFQGVTAWEFVEQQKAVKTEDEEEL